VVLAESYVTITHTVGLDIHFSAMSKPCMALQFSACCLCSIGRAVFDAGSGGFDPRKSYASIETDVI